ncbi:MAG: hypothetical protein BM556_16160 [Bacteriovorax sp. MedPE-SWde]|nr:MAG: hypothetical protein BM556_16160 [Bacteriovorax sp. MedPE-SWde]
MRKILIKIFLLGILGASFSYGEILKIGLATGVKNIGYTETHQFQSSLDKDFTEIAPSFGLDSTLYIFPHWLYVGFNTQYVGPVLSSSTTDEASFLRYSAFSGITIPARPFNLNIESEYYSDTISPNASTFGYEDMSGTRFSAIGDWLSKSGLTQITVKLPFFNTVEGRSDYMATLKFHFSAPKGKLPPSLRQGMYLSFDYSSMTTTIPGTVEIEINNTEMGMNLGYNW